MSAAALRALALAPVSPAAQLHAVCDLLSRPGVYLPGLFFAATDHQGNRVRCRAPEAVRFDVMAALVRLAGPEEQRQRAVACIVAAAGAKSLHAWEEDLARTEAEVLAALDAAITLAARGGP